MSADSIIAALQLPPDARVDQRVPKKLLMENGASTAADKRQINDGIEELLWLAALKPTNLGVPVFRDRTREYLEIAVLTLKCRPGAKVTRIIELIHRAVPYPVLLLATLGETVCVSAAHKRWSLGESGRVVVEEVRTTDPIVAASPTAEEAMFLSQLSVLNLPHTDLFVFYQGWLNLILALEAAGITGAFRPSETGSSGLLQDRLDARASAVGELATLRTKAESETQINRRVEINLAVKRLEARIAELDQSL